MRIVNCAAILLLRKLIRKASLLNLLNSRKRSIDEKHIGPPTALLDSPSEHQPRVFIELLNIKQLNDL